MAENNLYKYIGWAVIFSLMISGSASLISYMGTTFSESVDVSYNETFDQLNNITNNQREITGFMDNAGNQTNAGSFILNTLETPLKLIISTTKVVTNMGRGLVGQTGIIPTLDGFGTKAASSFALLFSALMIFLLIGLVWRSNKAA